MSELVLGKSGLRLATLQQSGKQMMGVTWHAEFEVQEQRRLLQEREKMARNEAEEMERMRLRSDYMPAPGMVDRPDRPGATPDEGMIDSPK